MRKLTFKNIHKLKKEDLEAGLLKAYQIDIITVHKNFVTYFNNANSRVFKDYNRKLGSATFLVDNLEVKFA